MGPRHRSRGPVPPAKVWPPNRRNLLWAGLSPTSFTFSRPAFVIGEYAEGLLVEVPLECPLRSIDAPCDVVQHALRPRKTGPQHPVAICRCHAHGLHFAVYPPGFVPYARRPLLDTANGTPSYASAARDAAAGVAWPRSREGELTRWWTTQTRLLRRLGEAFGAFAAASDVIAVATGLPLRALARIADAVGYRARGQALVAGIDTLGGDLDRLLLAGALAGTWGPPWRWQRSPARRVPLVPRHLDESVSVIASTNSIRGLPRPFS